MRYWDSSALVPLLVGEPTTALRQSMLRDDPAIVTWWGSVVECTSALHRLDREHRLSAPDFLRSRGRLEVLATTWREVAPSARLRRRARRLLGVHPLRAADALQLASALIVTDEDPKALSFVASDARLAEAARMEGFTVL